MAAVTATATAGGTKDGRENFVLCNVELGPVYIAWKRERERRIEKKRSGSGGKREEWRIYYRATADRGDWSRILKDNSWGRTFKWWYRVIETRLIKGRLNGSLRISAAQICGKEIAEFKREYNIRVEWLWRFSINWKIMFSVSIGGYARTFLRISANLVIVRAPSFVTFILDARDAEEEKEEERERDEGDFPLKLCLVRPWEPHLYQELYALFSTSST